MRPDPKLPAMRRLLCLGHGYAARALASTLPGDLWSVVGTKRPPLEARESEDGGTRFLPFDGTAIEPELVRELEAATHLLVSIPPDDRGDVFLRVGEGHLRDAGELAWVGYLSTTGVYGDRSGGRVDETSACRPTSERSKRRLLAEDQWLAFGRTSGRPVQVFRLAGIYGPGRNVLERIFEGDRPRRIRKVGQVFNRIHVDDIVGALSTSIAAPRAGRIYNLADDEPSPRHEVLDYACRLLGEEPESLLGPIVDFEEARRDLSPMAQSFWSDSRRVSNRRLKEELGYELLYPSYREGLSALVDRLPAP